MADSVDLAMEDYNIHPIYALMRASSQQAVNTMPDSQLNYRHLHLSHQASP